MDKVAQLLRSVREAKGVTLREVEEVTKIRCKYLLALEEEDYRNLPDWVYTAGFLRSYARFLDLDAECLVNALREEMNATRLESARDNTTRQYKSLIMKMLDYIRKE